MKQISGRKRGLSGMTLIEVMVASGLMAVLSLGLMSSAMLISKMQATAKASVSFNSIISYVNTRVGSAEGCANALAASQSRVGQNNSALIPTFNTGGSVTAPVTFYNDDGTTYLSGGGTSSGLYMNTVALNLSTPLPAPSGMTTTNLFFHAQVYLAASITAKVNANQNLFYNNTFVNIQTTSSGRLLSCSPYKIGTAYYDFPICGPGQAIFVQNNLNLVCSPVFCTSGQVINLTPQGQTTCSPAPP